MGRGSRSHDVVRLRQFHANRSARLEQSSKIGAALRENRELVTLEVNQDELAGCLDAVVDYALADDKRLLSVLSSSKSLRVYVDLIDGRSFGPGLYRLFSEDTCRFFGLAQPLLASRTTGDEWIDPESPFLI